MIKKFLGNWWIKSGVALVVIGWGPLLGVLLLSEAGLLSDPNPNPVGFGMLFFITFWPAVICLVVGSYKGSYKIWRVNREAKKKVR